MLLVSERTSRLPACTTFNLLHTQILTPQAPHPQHFSEVPNYSGETYYCPNGWRRININVADSAAEFDQKYGGWHVAYHGTNHELASTILTSGFLSTLAVLEKRLPTFRFPFSIEHAAGSP